MASSSVQVLITDDDFLELKGKHGYKGKEESEAKVIRREINPMFGEGKSKSSETTACYEGSGDQKALDDKPVMVTKTVGDEKSESSEITSCEEELEDDDPLEEPVMREWKYYHQWCKVDDSSEEEPEPKPKRKPFLEMEYLPDYLVDNMEARLMKSIAERVAAYKNNNCPTESSSSGKK